MIKFYNLTKLHAQINFKFKKFFKKALHKNSFILGKSLSSFEKKFSKYSDAKYCIGVGNGFDAIKISLIAKGVNYGDEVIVSSHTYIATWLAITDIGAKPVPVDIERNYFNLDIDKIEKKITKKTKGIVVVHMYGLPVNIEKVLKLAKKYNLFIIEDAAQAIGSRYNKKKLGYSKNLVAWSFYPGKNLGALGDGGAITTNNKKLYYFIKKFRNYGSLSKGNHGSYGVNSRLDDIQAGFLSIKLSYLNKWQRKRNLIANLYNEELKDNPNIFLPKIPKNFNVSHGWHIFSIIVKKRNKLKKFLFENGIETSIHYSKSINKQKPFKNYNKIDFIETEKITKSILSLPIGPEINIKDAKRICGKIKIFFNS